MDLATQVQSFELSPEEKEGAKSPTWDPSVLLPFPLPTVLLPLCPSSCITVETSSSHQLTCFPYTLISSLTYFASLLALVFCGISEKGGGKAALGREVWSRQGGDILLDGVSSPLACRKVVRWGLGSRCWGMSHKEREKQTNGKGHVPWN